MNELKTRHVVDVYDDYAEHPCEDYSQVYLKSEVDKVLADKDKDVTILQQNLQSAESVSSYRKRTIKEYEGKVERMRTDISEKDTYISNLKNDIAEKDKEIAELKKTLEQKNIAEGSVRRILWNLVDSGIIKEWYFNGEYNVLLSADDPHIQIAELKTKIDKVSLKFSKQLCHNKYKRCLGIAAVCFAKSYSTSLVKYDKESGLLRNFYDWWGKYWLKLAEKFKEEK